MNDDPDKEPANPIVASGNGLYRVTNQEISEQHILEAATSVLEKRFAKGAKLDSPKAVTEYLKLRMARLEHEVFMAIFVDSKHCVISMEEMFIGTIDGANVYPREVVKRALQLNAAALIFAHNHPSNDPEPSAADQRLTQRLISALGLVDIRVLDHFIIGGTRTLSFAERGLL